MHPGDDETTARGSRDADEAGQTANLSESTSDDTGGDAADRDADRSTNAVPMIRPAVTDDTAPTLPTIARSPRRFPPTDAPPSKPPSKPPSTPPTDAPPSTPPEPTAEPPATRHGRTPLWALVALLGVLLAGALIGRLTARNTPNVAASPGPSTIVATVPPIAPPPTPGQTAPTVAPVPARPADALGPWATRVGAAADVPAVAVQAYGYAQLVLQGARPDCHLGWTTLAGIGEVASHHGRTDGAVLEETGRSTPPILGPVLDGRDGRALVADTDAGAFDADATYDRAMGPMLIMPAMWRAFASDGDDDQIQDPYDIDDASLAVARLLCSGSEDMNQLDGWTASLTRLRAGEDYARAVFQAADSYGQRSRNIE